MQHDISRQNSRIRITPINNRLQFRPDMWICSINTVGAFVGALAPPFVSDSREGDGVGEELTQSSRGVGMLVSVLENVVGTEDIWIVGMQVGTAVGPFVELMIG